MLKIKWNYLMIWFLFLIVIVSFTSNSTQAFSRGNSLLNITFEKKDIAGRTYQSECIGECHLPIRIRYDGSVAPSSVSFDSTKLSYYFGNANINTSLITIQYLNFSDVNVTDEIKVCNTLNITNETGSTFPTVCNFNVSGSHIEQQMVWMPFSSLTIQKGTDYYFDFIGKIQPSTNKSFIDIIPRISIATLQANFTEAAYWNSSWGQNQEANITGGSTQLINFTVAMNISQTAGSLFNKNFSDIRIINGSCSGSDTTLLNYEFDQILYNNSAIIWVKIPQLNTGVGTAVCVYYNNTNAAPGDNPTSAWDDSYIAVIHGRNDSNVWLTNSKSGNTTFMWINNSATNTTLYVPGQIGQAINLSTINASGNDFRYALSQTTTPNVSSTGNFEMEQWFYEFGNAVGGNADRIHFNKLTSRGVSNFGFIVYSGAFAVGDSVWSGEQDYTDINYTWQYIAGNTTVGSAVNAFANKTNPGPAPSGGGSGGSIAEGDWALGYYQAVSKWGNAMYDELRFSNVSRSWAWTNRTYDNSNFSMVIFGATASPPGSGNTCTYSGSGNWIISCQDGCNLTTNTNLGGNNFTVNGSSGYFNFQANVTNWKNAFILACPNVYSNGKGGLR